MPHSKLRIQQGNIKTDAASKESLVNTAKHGLSSQPQTVGQAAHSTFHISILNM